MIDLDTLDDILTADWRRVQAVRSASAHEQKRGVYISWCVIEDDDGWYGARHIYSDDPEGEVQHDLLQADSVGKRDGYPSPAEALRALLDEATPIDELEFGTSTDEHPDLFEEVA